MSEEDTSKVKKDVAEESQRRLHGGGDICTGLKIQREFRQAERWAQCMYVPTGLTRFRLGLVHRAIECTGPGFRIV